MVLGFIATGSDLTNPINIPARESASFKISIHRDLPQHIEYSLDVESDEFLATAI